MAPKPQNKCSTQSFPPIHALTYFDGTSEFHCDGCKTHGTGKRYRCEPCNYDLHEYCSNCPSHFKTFMHPQHEIDLVFLNQQSTERLVDRVCDICHESVEGLFYRCKMCDFDVHLLCTQLPQHLTLDVHPNHQLEFSPAGSSPCLLCHAPTKSVIRYSCKLCKFDIHLECLVAACEAESSSDQKTNKSKSRRMFGFIAKKAATMVVTTALFGFPFDPTLIL